MINKNRKFDSTSEDAFIKNNAKRHSKTKKKSDGKKSGKKIALMVVGCFLGIILLIGLIVFLFNAIFGINLITVLINTLITPEARKTGDDTQKLTSADTTFEKDDGTVVEQADHIYTFLATGTDKSGGLTDVIMVAMYNIDKQTVSILQIPRDTYVNVSPRLYYDDNGNLTSKNYDDGNTFGTKINSAYSHARSLADSTVKSLVNEASDLDENEIRDLCKSKDYAFLGADTEKVVKYTNEKNSSEKQKIFNNIKRDFGIKYLCTLIYYNYGIPVDYHAQVNLSGFRGVVDAIGGVDLYVPQDMYYNDPYQDLYINLKKGQQHLNGAQAEDFVRFRSGYAAADIARLDAQKIFMSAFLKKLFSVSTVSKIDNIVTEIQKNLYTNLPLKDTIYFGQNALGIDLSSGISMTTLPGGGAWADGVSYYSANREAVMKLVNESFNKYSDELPEERFLMVELKNTPVEVSTSTVGDIEENAPDLGFLPEGSDHGLENESDDVSPDGENDDGAGAAAPKDDQDSDDNDVSESKDKGKDKDKDNKDSEGDTEDESEAEGDESDDSSEDNDNTDGDNKDESTEKEPEDSSENDDENTGSDENTDSDVENADNDGKSENTDDDEEASQAGAVDRENSQAKSADGTDSVSEPEDNSVNKDNDSDEDSKESENQNNSYGNSELLEMLEQNAA